VRVVAPDPGWARHAVEERRLLLDLLAPWLVADVHHVGSTAVPGLPAKPVIDLMAGIRALDDTAAIAPRLAPHDWHLVPPELDARPWRRLLVKVADNRRAAHLHLLRPATRRWTEQLEFRDRLRASPGLVSEYGALERRLAGGLAGDREAYTRAKTAFVQRVLAEQH